jgi:hypothetical protein
MAEDGDDFLVQIRTAIERRVNEQLARHAKVDPGFDPRRVVEIQIQQEREQLNRMLQNAENRVQMETIRALIEWLPILTRQLSGKR